MSTPIYAQGDVENGDGERPFFRGHWLSRHLTLISLEMGTRQQALMGWMAVSLWEEAAPLERNRTGCDEAMDGFLGGGGVGGLGSGQAQQAPLPPTRPPLL